MWVCALPPVEPDRDDASAVRDAGGERGGDGVARSCCGDADGGDRADGRRARDARDGHEHGDGNREGCDSGSTRYQPHDVLRLRRLPVFDSEPAWVREAFAHAPFAVVRRAQSAPGLVAVGIRGASRAQRFGTWVEDADVEFAVRPETLAACEPAPGREWLPAFAVLAALRRAPCVLAPYVWGPAGSVGFELASGIPTVTGSSDLDLLIRAPKRLDHAASLALHDALLAHAQRAGVRVDAQVETPAGGVALAELATGKPRVMVRSNKGVSLMDDPWVVVEDGHGIASGTPGYPPQSAPWGSRQTVSGDSPASDAARDAAGADGKCYEGRDEEHYEERDTQSSRAATGATR
jgi:phosphoribosyl-dephospho-CoA transferase